MTLENLGWGKFFAERFGDYHNDGYSAARISLEHKNSYTVLTDRGEMPGLLTGRMYFDAMERDDLPVVGDWVVVRILDEQEPKATIHAILPRKSRFSRKEAGTKIGEQMVTANVDTVFIVVGLDHNYNTRRIERYLALAWESGANPVVVLTKADLCDSVDARLDEVRAVAIGVPVYAVSVVEKTGIEFLTHYMVRGRTVALLGSSGVGKSTIINYLVGEGVQRVQEVRQDDGRGRHTTTHRQMFALESGALVIDTPGMRELQLWDADEGLAETFKDIEEFARQCRFSDCTHQNEPGCEVQKSLNNGTLNPARFENYLKMLRELHHLAIKQDIGAAVAEKRKWRGIHKVQKEMKKGKL